MLFHAPDVVARFERLDVFVNRGERGELQRVGEFLVAGAVAVFFDEVRDEVEDFFLPLGKGHDLIVGEGKGKVNGP